MSKLTVKLTPCLLHLVLGLLLLLLLRSLRLILLLRNLLFESLLSLPPPALPCAPASPTCSPSYLPPSSFSISSSSSLFLCLLVLLLLLLLQFLFLLLLHLVPSILLSLSSSSFSFYFLCVILLSPLASIFVFHLVLIINKQEPDGCEVGARVRVRHGSLATRAIGEKIALIL